MTRETRFRFRALRNSGTGPLLRLHQPHWAERLPHRDNRPSHGITRQRTDLTARSATMPNVP